MRFMRAPTLRSGLAILALLFATGPREGSASAVFQAGDIATLAKDRAVERALAPGEQHAYRIHVEAGEFLQVLVDQRGVDVVVTLYGPDDRAIYASDCPCGAKGTETISFVARVTGDYRLDVVAAP